MAQEPRLTPKLNYALIFNASKNSLSFTDKASGVILDVNERWISATGIGRSEAIGRTALELGIWVDPKDRDACMRAIQENSCVSDREVLLNLKGVATPHVINGQTVMTDQGDCVLWELQNISARRQIELEALHTRQQLQSILEASPVPLFVKDAHSRFVLMNRACESQWGISFADLKDKDGSAMFPASQMQKFLADDKAIFAAKVPVDFQEVYWNNAMQQNRIGHTFKNPIFNAAGEPLFLVCSMVDVTEQENTRIALQISQRDMNEAQRIAHAGTFVTDLETGTWQTSSSLEKVLGIDTNYPRTVAAWQTLLITEDRATIRAHFRAAMRRADSRFDLEYRIIRPQDGQLRWIHNVGQIDYNPSGRAIRVTGFMQDISQRKASDLLIAKHQSQLEDLVMDRTRKLEASNQELIAQQKFLRAVADGVPSMIGYWDRDLRCRFANKAYEAWFDVNVETILGMHIKDVLGADLFQLNSSRIQAVLAGEAQLFQREWRRPNGELGCMAAKYIPDVSNGIVQGFFVLIEDITELKSAGNSLMRLNEQLAMQAQVATQANAAKSDFLANMSHEIRTPLSAISGMAQLIGREPLNRAQSNWMTKLQSATRHLSAIINDILDLSKIEANKLVFEESPVEVATLFENVANMLQETVSEKGLTLVVDVAPTQQRLAGDATRLQQALLNYASNAVKFTDGGTVWLKGLVQEESEDSALLRFEVQDTGLGISPEKLGRLFSPFVQADAGTTRKFGGTGLGLVITKRLAEAMGGAVGAVSEVGKGSTFWFTARLKKCQKSDLEDHPVGPAEAEKLLKSGFAGRRVLLVEDDEFNREIGTILLQDVGLSVSLAEDGQAAVDMAKQFSYDLILMDMQMPKMDGLEATRVIRSTGAAAGVPIVALTANAFSEDRQRCLEAGMNDFVTKPVEPKVLYRVLLRQLMKRRAATTA